LKLAQGEHTRQQRRHARAVAQLEEATKVEGAAAERLRAWLALKGPNE
jgi:hypothetical protein